MVAKNKKNGVVNFLTKWSEKSCTLMKGGSGFCESEEFVCVNGENLDPTIGKMYIYIKMMSSELSPLE